MDTGQVLLFVSMPGPLWGTRGGLAQVATQRAQGEAWPRLPLRGARAASRSGGSVLSAPRNATHAGLSRSGSLTLHLQNSPKYLSLSKGIRSSAESHERTSLSNDNYGHT